MLLLLTRAGEDAARTAVRLEAMGHHVLVSPVISYEATGAAWRGPAPGGLIATSARAFMGLGPGEAGRAVWREVPLFLVGQRTLQAARAAGFAGPASTLDDSAALSAMVQALPPARLAYFAGTDRKSAIEDAIAAGQRHHLTLIETYKAVAAVALLPETVAALRTGEAVGILHFSRRSAEIFLCLAAAAGLDAAAFRHFCLSPDVAAPLREIHCDDVHIASRPDEASLLALLEA